LGIAVVVAAVNLRGPIVAVSPVLESIRADTGMSAGIAGSLTALPVICFGAFAPLAPLFARRLGIEAALSAALAVLAVGVLLRLPSSTAALFAGTVLIGAAIAVANVLLPTLVKRDFARHIGLMTGLYVAVFSVGASLAAGATVPLREATGLGWRPALAVWAVPAALAAILWLPRVRRSDRRARAAPPLGAIGWMWRDRLAWEVTLFMGLQSLGFYATAAWLPTIFVDNGVASGAAGLLLAVATLISVPASLVIPVLAARASSQRRYVVVTVALCGAGLFGLMLAPSAAPALWMVLLGLGQGAAIGLALTFIGLRSPDDHHASELSSMAQTLGYGLAALGPVALGAVHDLTGRWTIPVGLLVILLAPQLLAGLGASRDLHVGRASP
jgi:CP family cyanate transporter-like MFS transporter